MKQVFKPNMTLKVSIHVLIKYSQKIVKSNIKRILIFYSDVFQPTSEWQEIRPGQVVPSGLHVRLNLETGKKEAKLMDNQSDDSIKKIDDDAKSPKLRSYKDLQDSIAKEKIKFNSEFENVQVLASNFGNSSVKGKVVILEDLEYYLHQYDNARDFVTIG